MIRKKINKKDIFYGNFISINNSYENYINSLNELFKDDKKSFVVNAVIQKINEWESWPIISLGFDREYSEIIKDDIFNFSTFLERPFESDILYKK